MSLKPASLFAAAVLALCAAAPASAITYTYSTTMLAANEPSVLVPAPNAGGVAQVVFDTATLSIAVFEAWSGLTGPVTINHIHCCTAAAGTGTAGVLVNFAPSLTTSGFYSASFTLSATDFSKLLIGASDGKAYVNIHTANNPGGEIRGFLVGPVVAVPEPGVYAMMLAGLGAVGLMVRRSRQA